MNTKPLIFAPKMILCPVDLSAASRTVLSWARLFAEAYQAKLKLLHAEWPDYPPYFFLSQEAELEAKPSNAVRHWPKDLQNSPGRRSAPNRFP